MEKNPPSKTRKPLLKRFVGFLFVFYLSIGSLSALLHLVVLPTLAAYFNSAPAGKVEYQKNNKWQEDSVLDEDFSDPKSSTKKMAKATKKTTPQQKKVPEKTKVPASQKEKPLLSWSEFLPSRGCQGCPEEKGPVKTTKTVVKVVPLKKDPVKTTKTLVKVVPPKKQPDKITKTVVKVVPLKKDKPKVVTVPPQKPLPPKKIPSVIKKTPKDPVMALRPLLERGMVIWLKNRQTGKSQQCVLYSLIDAPYKTIKKSMTDYEALKKELPNMAAVKIVNRTKDHIDVYYEIDIPYAPNICYTQRHIFHKDGSIEVIPLKGLKGHWKWEPHPVDGGKRTIMAYYSDTDISEQGWILKQLLKHQPAIRWAINSSGAIISMGALHSKYKRPSSSGQKVSLKALMPFLKEGTLSLVKDRKVSGVNPLITYCLVEAPREKVWDLALDFEGYSKFVPQLYKAEIINMDGLKQDIKFTVHFPLVRFAYTLQYEIGDYTFKVQSLKGVSGQYDWHFYGAGEQTIIKYSALANIRNIGFWNKILDRRPDLEKALNISISQITLIALQKEAERLQKGK